MTTRDYDDRHPALDIGWLFVGDHSEVAVYKGHELRMRHTGIKLDDPDALNPFFCHVGWIDGAYQFWDRSLQKLIIRMVEKIDRQAGERQGTGYDGGARGHELQGRRTMAHQDLKASDAQPGAPTLNIEQPGQPGQPAKPVDPNAPRNLPPGHPDSPGHPSKQKPKQ